MKSFKISTVSGEDEITGNYVLDAYNLWGALTAFRDRYTFVAMEATEIRAIEIVPDEAETLKTETSDSIEGQLSLAEYPYNGEDEKRDAEPEGAYCSCRDLGCPTSEGQYTCTNVERRVS